MGLEKPPSPPSLRGAPAYPPFLRHDAAVAPLHPRRAARAAHPEEVEGLGLVATGMTSAQVATELFLSTRTVEAPPDLHLPEARRSLGGCCDPLRLRARPRLSLSHLVR